MTLVRKIRFFQTIGDDQPRPGTSRFHSTFSVSLQVSGRLGLSATPSERGPRNCGQLFSAAMAERDTNGQRQTVAVRTVRKKSREREFMSKSPSGRQQVARL